MSVFIHKKFILMKFLVAFCILCFGVISVIAQSKKTEFEFKIYGEDARGNKDSVIIGYSHNTSGLLPYIDTAFGDKNIIDIKYDSVFEMRVHKSSYFEGTSSGGFGYPELKEVGLSKRVTLKYTNNIGQNSCEPYGHSWYGYILAKVKYPPFKIYWDSTKFDTANYCVGHSYFQANGWLNQDLPFTQIPYTLYLNGTSSLTDSLSYKPLPPTKDYYPPYITRQHIVLNYPDGTTDSLQSNYMFQFISSHILTGTEDITQMISKVYPNPCREQLNLFLPEPKIGTMKVNIYGITGELYKVSNKISDTIVSVETSSLPIGFYIVEVIDAENKKYVAKFSKIE